MAKYLHIGYVVNMIFYFIYMTIELLPQSVKYVNLVFNMWICNLLKCLVYMDI